MAYSTPSNARAAAKKVLASITEAEALGLKVGTPSRLPTGGMALYNAIITAPDVSKVPEAIASKINEKCKLVEGDADEDDADEPAPAPKAAGRKAAAKKAPAKKGSARKAKAKDDGTPRVNKTATALKLMARAKGVTATHLIDEFDWQPHTLRGFVSLTNKRRREAGEVEIETVRENGVTSYIIKA